VWRIGTAVGPGAPPEEATPTPTATPARDVAEDEYAEVVSVTLALRLDAGQGPVDPTLEFHPGERVNVSVRFAQVAGGTRLGIRWYAGDRVQGTFLTDPQPAYEQATFGFYFHLPSGAPAGPWKVEILVGAQVAGSADFAVTPGEVRVRPPTG
jgi:hypothetical protein